MYSPMTSRSDRNNLNLFLYFCVHEKKKVIRTCEGMTHKSGLL